MPNLNLSKSKIIAGLQCSKRLYLDFYQPELAVEDGGQQRKFDDGNKVGDVALTLYPEGHYIEYAPGLKQALQETKGLLTKGFKQPIFEATFTANNLLIRADVLIGNRLIEVKSATSVKEQYIADCAIQTWVIEQNNHKLKKIELAHVNNNFVYKKEDCYKGFLHYENITEQVRECISNVPHWVEKFQTVLNGTEPDIGIGEHCKKPYACPYSDYCSPEQTDFPITTLPRVSKKVLQQLEDCDIDDIQNIPDGMLTNPKHERVRQAVISGKTFIDPQIKDIIKNIPYPRYYLDFETINPAVPLWLNTGPYKQMPFQWSCHIATKASQEKNGQLSHKEFLDLSGQAPMRAFTEALIGSVKGDGAVIVYNKSFEIMIMRQLAERFPEYSKALNEIIDSVVDLLDLTRAYYYHPNMHGSWSIKSVLPTMVPELNYSNLEEVKNGGAAQDAFLEAINPEAETKRKNSLEKNMLKYCALDTWAMVEIVKYFGGKIGDSYDL